MTHSTRSGCARRSRNNTAAERGDPESDAGVLLATNLRRGATLDQAFNDGVTDVVTGRRPLAEYDQVVREWQSNGGEQIRQEYMRSMAA